MPEQEVRLPSPPPDVHSRASMSGLFTRSSIVQPTSDAPSSPLKSESESAYRKKVGFLAFAQSISDVPQLSTPDSEIAPSLKSLPPSRDCQPSSRPILKQTVSLESVMGSNGITAKAADTMESLLEHLADHDRPSSIDAYQSITNLIKMYEEPPEDDVLRTNMVQLQKYIRRDLVVLDKDIEALPSEDRLSMGNLVMSALKVTVTMVWSPSYAPCLTDDFRVWILERSIHMLKEHTAPKATLLHYMHILATQTFRPQLLIHNNRCLRILEAVHELTDHVSGKAVTSERMLIYQKLFEQAKGTMKARCDLWLKNLLSGMSHGFREVRNSAITAGNKACVVFAGATSVTTAARSAMTDMFNDRTVATVLAHRLQRMSAKDSPKEDSLQVPQIWTIVLMLCNSGSNRLDSWAQLGEWLQIIQRCFNGSDSNIRIAAFTAWNRLIYTARPHDASDKIVSMLAKPAVAQLDRSAQGLTSKGTRQAVVSSYCMLLYYAFRPAASHVQYTRVWNEFIVKVMRSTFLSRSSANCDLSCRILSALFHNSTSSSRVWNETRAHENVALDPSELPAVDCKWTRSKMPTILAVMQLLVNYGSFGPDDTLSDQAYVAQTWHSLMKAFRESISKEIKASGETKTAFASIFAFLQQSIDGDMQNKRNGLLARILITELTPNTVLQALETSHCEFSPVIISNLMALISSQPEPIDPKATAHRCLELVSREAGVLSEGILSSSSEQAQLDLFTKAAQLLAAIPHSHAWDALSMLQASLVTWLERIESLEVAQVVASTAHTGRSSMIAAIRNLLLDASVEDYTGVDKLLEKLLLLDPELGRLLQTSHSSCTFGPQAKALLISTDLAVTSKDLTNDQANFREESFSRSQAAQTNRLEAEVQPMHHEPRPSAVNTLRIRPRHDDSQAVFVPIDSSPPDYEMIESQDLTSRQREVRARQQAEQALTFADIRSSPSVNKHMRRSTEDNSRQTSPEPPTTPTLPPQRQDEEDDQPPTPTPRAKKTLLQHLQPEIPSSPSSVIDGEPHMVSSSENRQSPLKALLSLQCDDGTNKQFHERKEQSPMLGSEVNVSTKQPSPELPVVESLLGDTSAEVYETATADLPSPAAYSDEYDAMAASQLSQNLVEESLVVSEQRVSPDVSDAPNGKRKRENKPLSGKRSKRRKSSLEDKLMASEHSAAVIPDEEEDCIVVDMSDSPRHTRPQQHKMRTRRAAKALESQTSSPVPSQSSHGSNIATPSPNKGSRKRRSRGTRTRSSHASRETSPATQVHVVVPLASTPLALAEDDSEMTGTGTECVSMLPAVVPESSEDSGITASGEKVEITTVARGASTEADSSLWNVAKIAEEERGAELAPLAFSVELAPLPADDATKIDFNIVSTLQLLLDRMDSDPSALTGTLDVSAIHSLCFKIGRKAQELGMKQ